MKKKVLVYFYDGKRRREALWTEPDPWISSALASPDPVLAAEWQRFMTSGVVGPLVEETPEGPVFVPRVALNEVLYLMVLEG